ncbi:MAG TPA: hypothetical protein VFA75_01805 [Nevskia sp.]|nr:hypothetical protein [Nevskia sp.]
MGEIVLFKPQAEHDAEANLCAFINLSRTQLTVFGAGLLFDQPVWDITGHIEKKGSYTRTRVIFSRLGASKSGRGQHLLEDLLKDPGQLMRPAFIGFAKAFYRYSFGLRPSRNFGKRLLALRCLDRALAEVPTGPSAISPHVLNRATAIAMEAFAKAVAYGIGVEIGQIAAFVNSHHLVGTPFSWTNPAPKPPWSTRIGPEAAKAREAKMPSQAALDAIAAIFLDAKKPRDVVTTGSVACMLAAPMRLHELLLMPSNCWIDQASKDGKPAYGLRWRAGKGAEPAPKWLNSAMASVAETAIVRIRKLTERARRIAAWYEEHPTQLYLPPELEHLRGKNLAACEIATLLGSKFETSAREFLRKHGLTLGARNYCLKDGAGAIRFADVERAFLKMLPISFPWASEGLGLRYSQMLFVIEARGLSIQKSTCPVMFQPITLGMLAKDLTDPKVGIFARHSLLGEDGKALRMTSHQARHLLNTIALIGGMTQLDVAKWSGRKNIKHNDAYDHRTPAQMLEHIRDAVGDTNRFRGPLATLPKNVPITRREFALQQVPTAHITELGWCIHDYTESPCEVFNDCSSCRDQVCIKGEHAKNVAAREMLSLEEGLLQKARVARADKDYGAEMWEQHHSGRVLKLRELVAIYDDPSVAEGTVIQLAAQPPTLPDARRGAALPSSTRPQRNPS